MENHEKKANILCTRIPDLAKQFSEKNKVSVGKNPVLRIPRKFFLKKISMFPCFVVGNFSNLEKKQLSLNIRSIIKEINNLTLVKWIHNQMASGKERETDANSELYTAHSRRLRSKEVLKEKCLVLILRLTFTVAIKKN